MAVSIGKKQNFKNIIMNLIAFMIQFIMSFWVSPIIVKELGTSAYGFIGLAQDFVGYVAVIATVFNSMAARFIANAYYKNDYKKANYYFNSLISANLLISVLIAVASFILIPNIEVLLEVPSALRVDVKITFALIFGGYIISLITSVFSTATFVTNRTDIQGVRKIISDILSFVLVISFFKFISIRMYWYALASLFSTMFVAIMNIKLTKKLTPEIVINYKYVNKSYVIELAKSGCWMAFTSVSTILLRGLDLTIANVLIGDYEMGLLSIARTIPNVMTNIISTITPIFTPMFIICYSKNDIQRLIEHIKKSINVMAMLLFVPITGFIVFSYDFYSLWQKSLTQEELVIITSLSILTIVQAYFNCTTSTMAQQSVVVNKLKLPAFLNLGIGIVSVVVEIFLITYCDMGLYAIVLSTTIILILRYVVFNPVYAAWCLKQRAGCFIGEVIKVWASIPVLILFMLLIRYLLPIHSWVDLCRDAIIAALGGYMIMIFLYARDEVKEILKKYK